MSAPTKESAEQETSATLKISFTESRKNCGENSIIENPKGRVSRPKKDCKGTNIQKTIINYF